MKRYHIDITGMSCDHCVQSVSAALMQAGAAGCRVDLNSNSAVVEFHESDASIAQLMDAVISAGYGVGGFRIAGASASASVAPESATLQSNPTSG